MRSRGRSVRLPSPFRLFRTAVTERLFQASVRGNDCAQRVQYMVDLLRRVACRDAHTDAAGTGRDRRGPDGRSENAALQERVGQEEGGIGIARQQRDDWRLAVQGIES